MLELAIALVAQILTVRVVLRDALPRPPRPEPREAAPPAPPADSVSSAAAARIDAPVLHPDPDRLIQTEAAVPRGREVAAVARLLAMVTVFGVVLGVAAIAFVRGAAWVLEQLF